MLLEQDGETALHLASSKGHLDIVKELLVHAASIDVANHDGVTALQRAAWYGHLETVKELLARGASIDFREEIYQRENDRPEKPENLRPDYEPLWTLITKCWRLKPEARPSADEIVEFLKNQFASQLDGL
ncbi:hypothetical protein AeRB84_003362 [Aphanomyces euteiches]|nr:hypothetical protein AeRB84_003362 [Aphanomyces euteiches]